MPINMPYVEKPLALNIDELNIDLAYKNNGSLIVGFNEFFVINRKGIRFF